MNLNVVLVRTEYSSNWGATARAFANMGGHRLILIDPKCSLDESARQMAAGAQDALANSIIYNNWQEFYAQDGQGLRIALTRRGGKNRKVFSLKEKVTELKEEASSITDLFLILGPEADGLVDDDLAFANFACHLPVYGDFASFNLAQAALFALAIVREAFPPDTSPRQLTGKSPPPIQPFYFPDTLIKEWLIAMGFDINARKASAYRTLRRLFLQNLPTQHELQVLEAVLQQNIRKLKKVQKDI